MLVLTRGGGMMKDNINNMIGKMAVIKELRSVSINEVSKALGVFKIEKLNIFSINNEVELGLINHYAVNNGCKINYMELSSESFKKYINTPRLDFLEYNRHSFYIVRNGNYINIKNMFETINGHSVHIGRWRERTKSSCIKSFRF